MQHPLRNDCESTSSALRTACMAQENERFRTQDNVDRLIGLASTDILRRYALSIQEWADSGFHELHVIFVIPVPLNFQ